MKIKFLSSQRLSVHKRRADRGRVYMSYIQILGTTAILTKLFNITAWWVYVLGGILVLGICYLIGYLDDKKQILSNEQSGYNKNNPEMQQILKDLDFIKQHVGRL